MGSLSLLQGIFPMQGSKPGLPHCRQILYLLSQVKSRVGHTNKKHLGQDEDQNAGDRILRASSIPHYLKLLPASILKSQGGGGKGTGRAEG